MQAKMDVHRTIDDLTIYKDNTKDYYYTRK